jgi:hypothetical protein
MCELYRYKQIGSMFVRCRFAVLRSAWSKSKEQLNFVTCSIPTVINSLIVKHFFVSLCKTFSKNINTE